MCPVKGQVQFIRGVQIFSNICGNHTFLIGGQWVAELLEQKRDDLYLSVFSSKALFYTNWKAAPLSLYSCRGLNEGVVLYDNEALEKLVNVDISMICSESMPQMGKRQVPSIEGEIPHQAWADPDFLEPAGSFRSKKLVEDSHHLLLANTSTYCLCIHEGLPSTDSCLWNSPSASRGFRRDQLCMRDGGS